MDAQALQPMPARRFEARPHPIATIAALLAVFMVSGVFVQLLAVCAPAIVADWSLHETALAVPMSAVLIGSGVGTITGGAIADTLGRRVLIGVSILLMGMTEAGASLANSPLQLAGAFFVGGVVMGSFYSAAMALVTELVRAERRPLIISFTVASLPIGLGVCSGSAAFLLPEIGWRLFFIAAALLTVPVLIAFLWLVPESPVFLARTPARHSERRRIVERLGLDDVLEAASPTHKGSEAPLAHRFGSLIRANPRATIGIWGLFFATYIFGNAILSWLPVALSKIGFSLSFASGALTAWTIGSMTATPLAGWCLSRINTNLVAAVGSAMAAIVTLSLALILSYGASTQLAVLAILTLGGVSSAAIVTALYTLVANTYPPTLRALGVGLSDAIGRVGGMAAAYYSVYIIVGSGSTAFFLILTVLMALVAAYLVWLHPRGAAV